MTTIKTSMGYFNPAHLEHQLISFYQEKYDVIIENSDVRIMIAEFMGHTSEYLYTEETIQDAKDRIEEIRSILSEMREDDPRRECLNYELRFLCDLLEEGDII